MTNILNFPYYIYPGTPCAGYHEILSYNDELIRLHTEILLLMDKKTPILFHLTIGAAMEEHNYILKRYPKDTKNNKFKFQWQQLCPNHVRNAIEKNIEVVHFIVSPNESFSNSRFVVPDFILNTQYLEWENTDDKTFESQIVKYKVMIFYTMMPTCDSRNSTFCDSFKKFFTKSTDIDYSARYAQTQNDIKFVKTFYKNLDMLIDKVNINGGITTCFSFAVFHMNTNKRNIYNFVMFKEIMDIFKKYPTNLLAEWTFFEENYLMVIFENGFYVRLNTGISYVKPIEGFDEGMQFVINLDTKYKIIFC